MREKCPGKKYIRRCGVLCNLAISETVMESLEILRNHLNDNKTSSPADIDVFWTILNGIEQQLNSDLKNGNNELHYDQYIVQCIDLEGKNRIEKQIDENRFFFDRSGWVW